MSEVILLTATINTNGCWWLQRSDTTDREQDYLRALELWLTKTDFEFVFTENSGADLSFLNHLLDKFKDRLEVLSFSDNNYERSFGKGYGELRTVSYAIDNSTKLKDKDMIHKVSGRYYLTNIPNVLNHLKDKGVESDFDLIAYYHPPMFEYYVIPTVYFGIKRSVYDKHMRNAVINDAAGIYMEHTLFNTFTHLEKNKVCFFDTMGIEKDQKSGTGNAHIEHLK